MITIYCCEICKSEYDTAKNAEKCEKSHVSERDIRIVSVEHTADSTSHEFPSRIHVELDNGISAEYTLRAFSTEDL